MTSLLRSVRLALIVVIFSSALVTQSQTGGTSSGLPDDSGSAGATPSDNSKPLPWKFLASPGGALDSTKWDAAIDALGHCEDPQKCGVPTSQVRDLVEATAGIDPTKTKATYVVIHVVDYGDNIVDHWYLYRSSKGNWGDPAWSYEKFSGQRIYGSTSVLFLFVHRNVPVLTLENGVRQLRDAPPIKALTDEERKGLSDKNLEDALRSNKLKIGESTEFTFCDETSGGQFQWFGNFGIPSAYANVRYESAVVKRSPANIENLKKILGLLFGPKAQAAKSCISLTTKGSDGKEVFDDLWGVGHIDKIGLPSDISIAGYAKQAGTPLTEQDRQKLLLGTTVSYEDEQLYWWDASIGIPVHKIKDLQYSDSSNTVTATQVDRQSAYAMFNVMFRPVDLAASAPVRWQWPRLLVGFPLASSPWDKLFAGGAVGLPLKPFNNFQFFAGATFLRNKQPATLAPGDIASSAQLQNDLKIKTTPKFTFGINVPVKSVIDRLKGG